MTDKAKEIQNTLYIGTERRGPYKSSTEHLEARVPALEVRQGRKSDKEAIREVCLPAQVL